MSTEHESNQINLENTPGIHRAHKPDPMTSSYPFSCYLNVWMRVFLIPLRFQRTLLTLDQKEQK